jgi:hypothetical protein
LNYSTLVRSSTGFQPEIATRRNAGAKGQNTAGTAAKIVADEPYQTVLCLKGSGKPVPPFTAGLRAEEEKLLRSGDANARFP